MFSSLLHNNRNWEHSMEPLLSGQNHSRFLTVGPVLFYWEREGEGWRPYLVRIPQQSWFSIPTVASAQLLPLGKRQRLHRWASCPRVKLIGRRFRRGRNKQFFPQSIIKTWNSSARDIAMDANSDGFRRGRRQICGGGWVCWRLSIMKTESWRLNDSLPLLKGSEY